MNTWPAGAQFVQGRRGRAGGLRAPLRRAIALVAAAAVGISCASCDGGERPSATQRTLISAPGATGPLPSVPQGPAHEVAGAWGPDRHTYTMQKPSPEVTLNAITDNPDMGDERNFVRIKPAGDPKAVFTDRVYGKGRYTAEVYFSNSASPSGSSATGVRVSLLAPATITGSAQIVGFVKSDNASPPAVWDTAVLTLPGPDESIAVRYVPDSAVLHTEGKANGSAIDLGQLVSEKGALVGCDQLDGVVSGETRCEGWVTVDFVTAYPDFTIQAWLGTPQNDDWVMGEKAIKPGESVTVLVEYKNTGTVDQNDVGIAVTSMPECAAVVPDSMYMADSSTDGQWQHVTTDTIAKDHPINFGNFGPNSNMFVKFDVAFCGLEDLMKVYSPDKPGGTISTIPFLNVGVDTDNGAKEADNDLKDAQSLRVKILAPGAAK